MLLGQEHGLKLTDVDRLSRVAEDHGYRVECSPIPEDMKRGGTWVAVRMSTFRLTRGDPIPRNRETIGGGVTVVRVPMSRVCGPDALDLELASVYVPSHAQLRRAFLKRFRAAKLISKRTILGTDRNTVRDLSLDVQYPQGKSSQSYAKQNRFASLFDKHMADYGLEDVFRRLEGSKAKSFTRLGPTVHTRIDALFGPKRSDDFQWYSYTATDTFRGPSWESDHLAIVTELKPIQQTNIAKGRPRVDPILFEQAEVIEKLNNMYREIQTSYPTHVYGHAPVMSYQLTSAAKLLRGLSADHKLESTTTDLTSHLQANLTKNVKEQTEQGPSPSLKQTRKAMLKSLRQWRKANKPVDPSAAHRRVAFEETSTKQFHAKFRAKQEKRYIPELYPTSPTGLPDPTKPPTNDPGEMVGHTTEYYRTLMSPKPSKPYGSKILTDKLKEHPLPKASRSKLESKIT